MLSKAFKSNAGSVLNQYLVRSPNPPPFLLIPVIPIEKRVR